MRPEIIHSKSFAMDASEFILNKAKESIKLKNSFVLGLCGGKTPEPVYREVAKRSVDLDWEKVYITFGDERCVGPEDEQSNYRMVKESLLGLVPIPVQNILRIRGEDSPEAAAKQYEYQLLTLSKLLKEMGKEDVLAHDLLLLGLGEDGHTASIFPETDALRIEDRLVVPNFVKKLDSWRITFTYKLINSSRNICFLVNDIKKKNIVEIVLDGDDSLPASTVKAKESLTWILGY